MGKKKGGGKGTTTIYTPQQLNPVLKDRKTTMPVLGGAPDPNRPAAGWPADPFEKMTDELLQLNKSSLHLIGLVTPQQASEDKSQWFAEAPEYVERTALVQNARKDLFGNVPWTGNDLIQRLRRVKAIRRWLDEQGTLLGLVIHTLRTEQADLVRMTDVVVTETDLMSLRPTLDDNTRTDLVNTMELPLMIWKQRLAGILSTKAINQEGRDALDEAEQQLQELNAQQQEPVPVTVAVAPPKAPAPVNTPAKAPRGKSQQLPTPPRKPKARKPGSPKTR